MRKGFVIIETSEYKGFQDQWQIALLSGTTEREAVKHTVDLWLHLHPEDRKTHTYELVEGAIVDDHLITEDDRGYMWAVDNGWDTLDNYSPLLTINAETEREVLDEINKKFKFSY